MHLQSYFKARLFSSFDCTWLNNSLRLHLRGFVRWLAIVAVCWPTMRPTSGPHPCSRQCFHPYNACPLGNGRSFDALPPHLFAGLSPSPPHAVFLRSIPASLSQEAQHISEQCVFIPADSCTRCTQMLRGRKALPDSSGQVFCSRISAARRMNFGFLLRLHLLICVCYTSMSNIFTAFEQCFDGSLACFSSSAVFP